jgi:hypothetical protein
VEQTEDKGVVMPKNYVEERQTIEGENDIDVVLRSFVNHCLPRKLPQTSQVRKFKNFRTRHIASSPTAQQLARNGLFDPYKESTSSPGSSILCHLERSGVTILVSSEKTSGGESTPHVWMVNPAFYRDYLEGKSSDDQFLIIKERYNFVLKYWKKLKVTEAQERADEDWEY